MVFRRRPLLRAAVVGGGAYMAGKNAARRSAEQEQLQAEQDARISDLEQQAATQRIPSQPGPVQTPEQAQAAPSSITDQLSQLARLHEQGALTDEEFAAAKARLI